MSKLTYVAMIVALYISSAVFAASSYSSNSFRILFLASMACGFLALAAQDFRDMVKLLKRK